MEMFAVGRAWCRGCKEWKPATAVRAGVCRTHANEDYRRHYAAGGKRGEGLPDHIWMGVSAEDQENAHARLPYLTRVRSRIRMLSVEPQIGPVDISAWLSAPGGDGVSWVIVGGESGRDGRPFDVEWARSLIAQCRAAGARPFVKQLGARPFDSIGAWAPHGRVPLHGPPFDEWDPLVAVREFPAVSRPTPLTKWPKRPRSRQDRALRNYVRTSLVAARTHSGLLQDEAARLAGLSRSVMACIERGRQVPSILQLYRLARAYRISPSRFLP